MISLIRSGASLMLAAMLSAAPAAAAEPQFIPAYEDNFPDAFVLRNGAGFIAYATNDGINLPMLTSADLVHWAPVMDAARPGQRRDGLPALAPWVKAGFTWAPEVIKVGARWLLYYTANHRQKDVQCIGVAVADSPTGPFRDAAAEPLVCQFELGGSIDANPFRDSDGKLYLYWKSDGNRVGKGTWIWGQPLSPDGLSVTAAPVGLVRDDKLWENRLVEAPSMVRSPAGHVLFFSAAYYGWNEDERLSPYGMGYAACNGPLGPCTDAPENPILHSYKDRDLGCLSGPGHQSIFEVGERRFISFHAWAATKGCRKAVDERYLYVAPLFWKEGKPQIGVSVRATPASGGR